MLPKKLLKKFFNFLIFFLLIFILYLIISRIIFLFRIKNIIIVAETQNRINLRGLKPLENQIIVFVNENKIKTDLIRENPLVENITLRKKLPDTLFLIPHFSRPIAQIQVNNGFFHLSKNGRILKKTKDKDTFLPLINFYQKFSYRSYQTGDYLKYAEIIYSLKAIEKIKSLGLNNIKEVKINNSNLIICQVENKEIYFNSEKDVNKVVYELEIIIKKIKEEKKDFRKLDLRFSKPIVVFL